MAGSYGYEIRLNVRNSSVKAAKLKLDAHEFERRKGEGGAKRQFVQKLIIRSISGIPIFYFRLYKV